MNLRIKLIDPTGRTDWKRHDVNYYEDIIPSGQAIRCNGVMFYPGSTWNPNYQKEKNRYEIHIVRQKTQKYRMIKTLFHELTHYVISTAFNDSEKMHNWLDKNNE